jgi:hypothetical protein
MLRLLRIALLLVIAMLMVTNVVAGLATAKTGPVEKVTLVGFGALLVMAAVLVSRIGREAVGD